MKIGRLLVILIVIALAVFVGLRANKNIQAKKLAASRPAPDLIVPVETATASKTELLEKIHAVGGIQAESEFAVFSKVSGKLGRNNVRMGSDVQPGQIVSIVNRDEVGYDFKPYEVKSDAKGVVTRVLLNPGATVTPSAPIMNLADIDTVKVVAAVDEKQIRFVRLGQSARVLLEAYPGETFNALVSNISPVCNPVNRTIDVELSLPNPAHRVKPGMYAEVEWIQSRRTAWVIPLAALIERSGQKAVFLASEGRAVLRPVTVGAVLGDVVEILSGLTGDDRIVTTGASQLNDKDKIKPVETASPRK
jgi:membrane fusion protein, multidrug efflux system